MTNNRGFTLIEVLASIFILFLVSTVFFQFFIMSQKTTTDNEDKLVAVNLAKSVMEQLKVDSKFDGIPIKKLNPEKLGLIDNYKEIYGKPDCETGVEAGDTVIECKTIKEEINDQIYSIVFSVSEKNSDIQLGLYSVEVRIYLNGQDLKTTLEGLVKLK